MKNWSDMSSVAQGATVAALLFPLIWAVGTFVYPGGVENGLVAAVVASVFCGCIVPALIAEQRMFGGADQRRVYKRALSTGELPNDAELSAWQRWLDRSRKKNRSELAVAVLVAIVAGLSVMSTVIRWALTDLDLTNSLLRSALMVLGAIVYFASWQRQHRRVARLAARVEHRARTAS